MNDKVLHFVAGGVIAFGCALIFGPVAGILAGAAAGILKEIRDEIVYGGADWRDLLATCAGAMVGVAIA